MSFRTYNLAQYSRGMVWFMAVGWAAIVAKCALVWWATVHWHAAFHPIWIVGPTVALGALATLLWLIHREE